jgi:hypothetical protein
MKAGSIGYPTILILLAVVAVIAAAILKLTTRRKHPAKACARCGRPSTHGYAKAAEAEPRETVPVCVDCLLKQLDEDYRAYHGRAVVVQPVPDLPCYVFRPRADWSEVVRNDLDSILDRLDTQCHSCGRQAQYAWVNAVEPGPVAKLPKLGIKSTLLTASNSHPVSLCSKCIVSRISHSLSAQEGGYSEICGPVGGDDGIVIGTGY